MDIDLFSDIIRKLILVHDRVSLPGMGSFIAETAPSVFSDRAMVIHPPFRRILFRPSEIWNDGLLEDMYSKESGLGEEDAKTQISDFVGYLREELNANKSYRIPEFGTMRATEQNDYFFVAEKTLFNYMETFGLEPLNIKILPKKGEVETHSSTPVRNFFREILVPAVGVQTAEPEIVPEPEVSSEVEMVSKPEHEPEHEHEHEPEHEPEHEHEPELGSEPESAVVSETEPEIEASTKSEMDSEGVVEKKESKFIKRVIIVLSVVFFIIAVIVAAVVFKDELRPFWEWILYSKEEREFLRNL